MIGYTLIYLNAEKGISIYPRLWQLNYFLDKF